MNNCEQGVFNTITAVAKNIYKDFNLNNKELDFVIGKLFELQIEKGLSLSEFKSLTHKDVVKYIGI